MTEAAPPASSVAMDDDLINYEVDDIDLGEDMEAAPAADAPATAQMTVKKSTAVIELDEIDWEDHDNVEADSGENDGGRDSATDANAATTSFDLDVNGSNPDGTQEQEVAATDASGNAAVDGQDLDIGLDNNQENDTAEGDWEGKYDEEEAAQESHSAPKDAPISVQDDETDKSAAAGDTDEDGRSPGDDAECPDITVTYNNEEFPLFHGQKNFDNQDGFFHDQSILDITVDQLLGKFREELASDLGPQDEIVLQVDEMGLEYGESTQKDHCASVTLRQIHEIFEQLAKNQDPDATRTLYTSLVIRLHPAKRLDLLINEAFNGKGLDEVSHSFQSSQQNGERPAAEETGNGDMYVDSSDADDDGSGAADDDQEGEGDDEDDVQDEDGADEEEQASQEGAGVDAENDGADGEADEYEDDIDDMVDLDDDNDRPDQYMQQPSEYTEENDNDMRAMAQPPGNSGDNAFDNSHFQADQGLGDNTGDGNEGDENAGLDLLDFGEDDTGVVEADPPDKGNTSASVTLNGDGDNEITYEDDGLNGTASDAAHAPVATSGGDGGLGEIDWRDGPDDEVAEMTVTPAKRSFADVEVDLGLGDESDAKRQRS